MAASELTAEHALARPSPRLAPFVRRCVGYRYDGLEPGTHRGLPSPELTLVLSLDGPLRVTPPEGAEPVAFAATLAGLHTRPATIAYGREMHGIELDLTPRGARALLGLPAAELTGAVVDLADVLGSPARELLEGVAAAPRWAERFALLEGVLARRARDGDRPPDPTLEAAWELLVGGGGRMRVGDVAREVGWTRRHLDHRFAREYGLSPKAAARVARFTRSNRLLRERPGETLAAAAAACGYYDQAHMAREWNELAGCPPSRWLADEELPFVQDGDGRSERSLAA